MENTRHHPNFPASGEKSEFVYQSLGYDSGICLSNYRSTDGGSTTLSRDLSTISRGSSTIPRDSSTLSRDSVDGPSSTQPRNNDGGDTPVEMGVQGSSSGPHLGPMGAASEEGKTGQQGCCFYEDHFYEQNDEGDTLLHLAIIKPDTSIAIRMIEMTRMSEYFDIGNKPCMHTPLHLAVVTSQAPVVRALLLSGASTTSRDDSGNTALHLACKQGDIECVKQLTIPLSELENRYLWDRGTPPCAIKPMQSNDVNLMNYEGESSLHLALFSGKNAGSDIFDYLVTYCSADINTKDGKCGYTVLHQAVKSKDTDLVRFLIRYPQLAVNELCYSGNSALDIAVSLNLPQLEMDLCAAGAVCTESSDSSDASDDNQVDDFDDLMIGGLRINT